MMGRSVAASRKSRIDALIACALLHKSGRIRHEAKGWGMASEYVPILVMVVVATGLACVLLGLSLFIGPRKPSLQKLQPYESGIQPLDTVRRRFPVRFHLIAMLFIVFDIEAIFFYPWAVIFKRLDLYGLIQMLIFIGILLVGYVYIWRKGAFEWE
jgi:NADH-quinone oxidoreductase subunit A